MGPEREGPLRNPKGKERDDADPLKHVRSKKFISNGNIKSTCASSECGETKSTSGVVEVGILCLHLLWGLDACGCQLLRRRGVVPSWNGGHHASTGVHRARFIIRRYNSSYEQLKFKYFKA